MLFNLVQNHFRTVRQLKNDVNARLRSSIVPLFVINHLIRRCSYNPEIFKEEITKKTKDKTRISFKTAANIIYKTIKSILWE